VCLIDSNNKIRKAIPVANKDIEPSAKEISSINTELLEKNRSLEKIQKIY
jgi:hypothetical protein